MKSKQWSKSPQSQVLKKEKQKFRKGKITAEVFDDAVEEFSEDLDPDMADDIEEQGSDSDVPDSQSILHRTRSEMMLEIDVQADGSGSDEDTQVI